MKFGIVAAKEYVAARELLEKVSKYIESKNQQVLESRFSGADAILTLGGDGTLIHTACEYADLNVPFFGINAGTLGFLTAAEGSEWKEAIDKIIKADYVISERMMLETRIGQKTLRALNEIVVKGMYRVVDLEILVNGQKFLNIVGDGVIVSTPTGSTAYSLSAGGPIVDAELDSLVVTPISAVGLPIPSVVLSADDEVLINIVKGSDVWLAVDGQEHVRVTEGQSIKIYKGKYRVRFGYFDRQHFLKALNAKFGLSGRLAK